MLQPRLSFPAAFSLRHFIVVLFAALALLGCDPRDALRQLGVQPATAHERYARALTDAGLAATSMGRDWLVAGDSAIRAPLDVALPFREAAFYTNVEARAVAYRFSLRDGQRLTATLRVAGLPVRLFVDLFEQTSDSTKPFEHRATADSTPGAGSLRVAAAARDSSAPLLRLDYEVDRTGTYVLRVQPELLRSGRFDLSVRVDPVLAFPVQGGSNRAVQSLFGADRDAGRRSHHGIDIFAPRGTPVLAATDGVVRSTSPNELGGNVVWLSDSRRGQTLYYAHLDAHAVNAGQRVQMGDTLGFVGNTGNARTTRPHLHFGIYRRGQGPVDPYPFVRQITDQAPVLAADTARLGERGRTIVATTPLLASPSVAGDTVRRVARDTPVRIVGAAGRWYRVQLDDGASGYLAAQVTGELR